MLVVDARPMRLEDCLAKLRREDSLECRATGARDDHDALRTSLLASTVALTFRFDGQPVAFGGIVNEPVLTEAPTRGLVWLLTTDACRAHPLATHRMALRFLEACGWDVLHNHVDAHYLTALRWLSALGFKVAPPAPWGPFGAPFHAVEWRRTWTHSPS